MIHVEVNVWDDDAAPITRRRFQSHTRIDWEEFGQTRFPLDFAAKEAETTARKTMLDFLKETSR